MTFTKEHGNGTVNSGYLSHLKCGISVNEFVKRGDYVHAMFESLARKSNSAQSMNPAIGFNATLMFITYPEKGGKGPASKNPNRLPFDRMHKKKDCMIKITNSDEICCARAIVTMKEYVDGDPDKQYNNLCRGRPIQERLAKQLHREAGVPEGPCGYEELEKFQAFLGRQSYKIIVVDHVSCAFIFQGNVNEYDKVIYLVKHGAHFNGLRSIHHCVTHCCFSLLRFITTCRHEIYCGVLFLEKVLCKASKNAKEKNYYAKVNSTCAQPPSPRALPFFCLGWQIPGGGDS